MIGNKSRSENGAARNPYLFIVGCTRSGTTLLPRMFNNHPQIAVVNDSLFAILVLRHLERPIDPSLTPELVEKVRTYPRFSRLGLSDEAGYQAASKSINYSQFVSALFSEHAELNGKHLAGEKSPGFVRYLPRLQALFPLGAYLYILFAMAVTLPFRCWNGLAKAEARRRHSSFGKKNR